MKRYIRSIPQLSSMLGAALLLIAGAGQALLARAADASAPTTAAKVTATPTPAPTPPPAYWAANLDALDPAVNPNYKYSEWPNTPPPDCPLERSKDLGGFVFTGRYAVYQYSDTWYPTWAKDGNCYSCYTDGDFRETPDGVPLQCTSGADDRPWSTGTAKIVGDDPLNLGVVYLGKMYSGHFLYPSVSLAAGGHYYIGTYTAFGDEGNYFTGYRYSADPDHFALEREDNWVNPYWINAVDRVKRNFFGEKGQAKLRVLHAVNFGQDNRLSPDGKVYLTAHGFAGGAGRNDWDKGDAIYLCRVGAKPRLINNPKAYEFFAGQDAKGRPRWSKNVTDSRPILEWANHLGSEGLTWNPGLKKFILFSCRLSENEIGGKGQSYNLMTAWEADRITGPYRLVHYLRDWGPQTYFPNIPAKFISADGKTAWLVTSSNYHVLNGKAEPKSCRYACSMHEIRFLKPGEKMPQAPPLGENIAPQATITVVSTAPGGYDKKGLTDGVVDGSPHDPSKEWASNGCRQEAWLRLDWKTPVRINRVRLYDRPVRGEQILGGRLLFSDGSVEPLRVWLSDSAQAPGEVSFPTKTVSWMKFYVDQVTVTTQNAGLSEIEVYKAADK